MADPNLFQSALGAPATDDAELVALLGSKGYTDDVPLCQFAAWAEGVGLFEVLATQGTLTIDELIVNTPLSEPGADALVGVLASLGLILRGREGLTLAPLASEYLVPGRPFYMGESLFLTCRKPLPAAFVRLDSGAVKTARGRGGLKVTHQSTNMIARIFSRALKKLRGWEFGGRRILENQHSRNFPATVAAAQLPLFEDARCVVDMAGGSGTFAIPFARHHPDTRIVLTDLPQSLAGVRRYLRDSGVLERVELIGMDVFAGTWAIPECDVIFFGNFIHGFDRDRCLSLARKSREKLKPGGTIVFHELVWNENKDGPLKTALFNVTMRNFGGRQRTVTELHALLRDAGFDQLFAIPTAGGFVAVGGIRVA